MQNFNTKQPVIHRLFELLALLFTLKSDHNCVQAHAGFQHSWNGLHTPISVNRKLLNEVQTGVNEFIDPEVDTMKWKNNERTELNATLYNQIEETFKSFDLNQCEVFFADQYKISLKKYENFILEQAISSVLQSSDPADTIILAQNVFNNGHSSGEGWHQDVFPEIDEVVDPTSSTIMFSFGKYACAYEDPSQRPFNKDLQKEIRSFCQNLDYPPLLAAQVPLTMNIFVSGIRSGAYDFQDSTESPEVAVEHMVQSLCKGIESEWNFLIHRVEMYYMNLGWISALMYQEDTQYYHYSYSSENKLVNTNIAESNNTDIYSTNAAATGDDGVVKNLTQDFNLESEATQYESHNYSATVEQENTQSNAIEVTNNETQIDTYQPDFENYKVESDNPLSTIEEVMEQNKDDTAAAEINNEGVLYMLMKFQVKALQKFDQEQIAMIVKQELQKIVLSQLYQIAENTFRETQNGYEVQEDLSDFKDTRRHLGVNGPTHRYMGEKSEPSSMLQKPPELIHADVNLYPLVCDEAGVHSCYEVRATFFIDLVAQVTDYEEGSQFYYDPELVQLQLVEAIEKDQIPGEFFSWLLLSDETYGKLMQLSESDQKEVNVSKRIQIANPFYVWVALMIYVAVSIVFVRYLSVFYHLSDHLEHQIDFRPLFYPQSKQYRSWIVRQG